MKDTELQFNESELAAVRQWKSRIEKDKKKWTPDFDRMRENMKFVSGLQWDGQKNLLDDRYVCNITLKQIRMKVATLYAKNPTAEPIVRKRMNYMLWSGDANDLLEAMQRKTMANAAGLMDMEAEALLADFMRGKQEEELTKKVAETLETVCQYQVDQSRPTFKQQMKALVTRTVTCGVGYVRLRFIRDEEPTAPSSVPGNTIQDRQAQLQESIDRMQDEGEFRPNDLNPEDPRVEQLKSLALSLGVSAQVPDAYTLPERIEFDFLPPTAVIPDANCRKLSEFIAARHITIEYSLPSDEVNAMFGVEISGGEMNEADGEKVSEDQLCQKNTKVYEVLDFRTKTHFYIAEGWKGYLRSPEPLEPCVSGFWPLFALTFNDIETDDEAEASIFPPSDVDLVRHPQKEWNRTRDTLRDVRNAGAPKWMVRKGALSKDDLRKITDAVPNEVVELESVAPDTKLSDVLVSIPYNSPDPAIYSTAPLSEDLMMGGGLQEANLGNAQPGVTATVGTIAEQSRLTVSASNVDDLDEFLSLLNQAMGEMALSPFGFTEEIVRRISGPGAAWPSVERADYINQIYLKIKAASSGRPNKALDIANYERVAAQLIAAGANPIGVIEEGIRRLDDDLDVTRFLPVLGSMGGSAQQQSSVQPLPPGMSTPLPAA